MNIIETNCKNKNFYSLIGPFLGSKQVHQELGEAICVNDEQEWLFVMEGKKLIAFSSYVIKNKKMKLCYSYVEKSHREKGIFTNLLQKKIEIAKQKGCLQIEAVVTKMSIDIYEKADFCITLPYKNFYKVMKQVNQNEN
jgi:predicted GNAT family acetyltransferase